jgi:hypothetical protein
VIHLRDEIAQRNAQGAGEPHGPAVTRDRRKVSVRRRKRGRITPANGRDDILLRRAGQAR